MIKLYGKPIRVNKASQDKKSLDVGANLYVGNLDPDVDEKLLYDTFGAFGVIVTNPKIMRDPDTGNSRGFGFISYDSSEASDAAIESMNRQYLCNRQIKVSCAYKKDTKGECHGTPAERTLASSNPSTQKSRPHTMFASGPPTLPKVGQPNGGPLPSQPFSNGVVPPVPTIPAMRPLPPSTHVYQPMQQMSMPPPQWQQMGQPQGMPPQHLQQFRPPPPNIPPPASNMPQMMNRPPPPPAKMTGQHVLRPPPPPQQMAGGHYHVA